jgi:hypothetical protein
LISASQCSHLRAAISRLEGSRFSIRKTYTCPEIPQEEIIMKMCPTHKAGLSKFKKIEIIPCILSDHNAIKLKLNNKNKDKNMQTAGN